MFFGHGLDDDFRPIHERTEPAASVHAPHRLATKGLLLAVDDVKAGERTSPNDLFLHSTHFVVVDKHGRVRGTFDGTEPSSEQKIVEAIQTLLQEDPA